MRGEGGVKSLRGGKTVRGGDGYFERVANSVASRLVARE